jgi:hypothetical protein
MNIEKNKLFAEFLGRAGKVNKSLYTWKGIDKLINDAWVSVEDMKFDSDWNWLMQVVDHIESLEDGIFQVNILQEGTFIQKQCHSVISDKRVTMVGILVETKFESTYEACLEFIEKY